MKKISISFLSLFFIFMIVGFVFPLNKASAFTETVSSICGYNKGVPGNPTPPVDITCNYKLQIGAPAENNFAAGAVKEATLTLISDTESNPNFESVPNIVMIDGVNATAGYGNNCNGVPNCFGRSIIIPTRTGTVDLPFLLRWDNLDNDYQFKGVYEATKSLIYTISSGGGTPITASSVTLTASPLNYIYGTSSVLTAQTLNANGCKFYSYNLNNPGIQGSFLGNGTSIGGGAYTFNTGNIEVNYKGYYVSCSRGGGFSFDNNKNKFVLWPKLFKEFFNNVFTGQVFAEDLGVFSTVFLNEKPLPSPTVSLMKTIGKTKNLVDISNTDLMGTTNFTVNISGLLNTNILCTVYNNTTALESWFNNIIIDRQYNNLPYDSNDFQIKCNDYLQAQSVVRNVKAQNVNLTGSTTCDIPDGGNSCQITTDWNTTNSYGVIYPGSNVVTEVTGDGTINADAGSKTSTITGIDPSGIGSKTLTFKNKVDAENNTTGGVINILRTRDLTSKCVTGTLWNTTSHKCISTATIPLTSISINGSMVVGTNLTTTLNPG